MGRMSRRHRHARKNPAVDWGLVLGWGLGIAAVGTVGFVAYNAMAKPASSVPQIPGGACNVPVSPPSTALSVAMTTGGAACPTLTATLSGGTWVSMTDASGTTTQLSGSAPVSFAPPGAGQQVTFVWTDTSGAYGGGQQTTVVTP
jgi:hypothetical protein